GARAGTVPAAVAAGGVRERGPADLNLRAPRREAGPRRSRPGAALRACAREPLAQARLLCDPQSPLGRTQQPGFRADPRTDPVDLERHSVRPGGPDPRRSLACDRDLAPGGPVEPEAANA